VANTADVIRIEFLEKDALGVALFSHHVVGRIQDCGAIAGETISRRHNHEAPGRQVFEKVIGRVRDTAGPVAQVMIGTPAARSVG